MSSAPSMDHHTTQGLTPPEPLYSSRTEKIKPIRLIIFIRLDLLRSVYTEYKNFYLNGVGAEFRACGLVFSHVLFKGNETG